MKKETSLGYKAFALFLIMLLSKVMGFGRDMLMAYKFGTSYISDAYTVAITLPTILYAVLTSGFIQSYIPISIRMNAGRKGTFFSNIIITLTFFSVLIASACFIWSDLITAVLAPGFDEKTKELTSVFISIIVWIFPFNTAFSIMSAHLQTQEKFLMSNFCDFIIINALVIATIFCATKENSVILAVGYTMSMAVAFLILLAYFIKKRDVLFRLDFIALKTDFVELLKIAFPVGLSFMINQLNSMTDQMFSSMLGKGVTSSLNYANKIQSLFLTMTTLVFMTICFPRINRCFAEKKIEDGLYYVRKGYSVGAFFAIPFAFYIIMFARPIVRILFQRGAFDTTSTMVTAECLTYYSLGIPFYTYTEIESRTLTADMRQKIILKNTFLSVLFNIVMDYILMGFLGHKGLSLATSLSGVMLFCLMGYDLKKLKLWAITHEVKENVKKIFSSSLISVVTGYLLYHILCQHVNEYISFMLGTLVFGLLFLLQSVIYKTGVFRWLVEKMLKNNMGN